jgi:hypothetical protein
LDLEDREPLLHALARLLHAAELLAELRHRALLGALAAGAPAQAR